MTKHSLLLTFPWLLLVMMTTINESHCYGNWSELSSACRGDFSWFKEAEDGGQMWARIMSDATGKEESGKYTGNLVHEGDYWECISAMEPGGDSEAIRGMYCLALWTSGNRSVKQGLGYCIPHSCTDMDARILLYNVSVTPDTPAQTATVECRRHRPLSPGAIFCIVFLVLFALIAIVATIFDVVQSRKCQGQNKGRRGNKNAGGNVKDGEVGEDNIQMRVKDENPEDENNEQGGDVMKRNVDPDVTTDPSAVYNGYPDVTTDPSAVDTGYPDVTTDPSAVDTGYSGVDKQTKPSKPVQVLLTFSLRRNLPGLLNMDHSPGSFTCLHGIRFLTMSWIIFGHCYHLGLQLRIAPTVENPFTMNRMFESVDKSLINHMPVCVESFFVMSGMLVTLSFLKTVKRQGNKVTCRQMGLYYFHRYWRLTPMYGIVLLIYATLFHYLGEGPFMMNSNPDVDGCANTWWAHLLYIENLWLSGDCMGWSWYVVNDFQFHLMAPIFLAVACRFPRYGLVMMILGYCGSLFINFLFYFMMAYGLIDEYRWWLFLLYFGPWARAKTFFMGMILGFIIYHKQKSVQLGKPVVVTLWVLALAFINISLFVPADFTLNLIWDSIMSSIRYDLFAAGVMWIIFACVTGHGGPVNSILSWKVFVPLSRLTYMCYLIHPIFLWSFAYSIPKQIYFYDRFIVYLFFGNLMITMAASFVMSLVFEVPLAGLEKVFIKKDK